MTHETEGLVFGARTKPGAAEEGEGVALEVGQTLRSLSTYAIGQLGEEAACRYLRNQGLEIVERNWRSVFGEADIVAADGETAVLVEVKTRVNDGRAERLRPELAVTREKRERYARIASLFMTEHPDLGSIRFDVASVELFEGGTAEVSYLQNAYEWDD